MLVWFMHGASVRNPGYADSMRSRLIAEFASRGLDSPEFYSAFWGDLFGSANQLWDSVIQDLAAFEWEHPTIEIEDVFHYRQRREQLVSGFFNDIFNYLNPQQGREVRKLVARQFLNFLSEAPREDNELHIVAHSLGSVILWDMLFSDRYNDNDPSSFMRQVIKGLSGPGQGRRVTIRSITTIGSPLLYFNQALNIQSKRLHQFASRYQGKSLRWINIIHASDIFAYPLRSSLALDGSSLEMQDHYLGERNFIKRNVGDFAMALGLATEHSRYWCSRRVAGLITANLLGDFDALALSSPILEMGDFDDL